MAKKSNRLTGLVRLKKTQEGKKLYGTIIQYHEQKGKYEIWVPVLDKNVNLSESEFTVIPRKDISIQDIKRFVCADILYDELVDGAEPEYNVTYPTETILITLDDMEKTVRNLAKRNLTTDELYKCWISELGYMYDECYCILDFDEEITYDIFDAIVCDLYFSSEYNKPDLIDYDRILEDIEKFRHGEKIFCYDWTYDLKTRLARELDNKDFVDSLNDDEIIKCREVLEHLAAENDPAAIECIGYSYYGGNRLYPCDFYKSRDCFLKLMESEGVDDHKKGQYANTLGYIYYYGRCNDGVPEYEQAFKYYQIGAACLYYESIYKLGDMFLHGYGTPVNKDAAKNLINLFYEENLNKFLKGEFDCKFADLALRKANLCRDGIETGDPLGYYLVADFAIRKRLVYDHYGDANVFMGIQSEIAKYDESKPISKKKTYSKLYPYMTELAMRESVCKISFKEVKDGIKITSKRMPQPGHNTVLKFLYVVPDARYCMVADKATETAKGVTKVWTKDGNNEFYADNIERDYDKDVFYFLGEQVAYIQAEKYVYKLNQPPKKLTEKHQFARVTFTDGGRGYDYLADDFELFEGDKVIVFANGEEKEVTVIRVFEMSLDDMPLEVKRYKKILKKI